MTLLKRYPLTITDFELWDKFKKKKGKKIIDEAVFDLIREWVKEL